MNSSSWKYTAILSVNTKANIVGRFADFRGNIADVFEDESKFIIFSEQLPFTGCVLFNEWWNQAWPGFL